MFSLRERKERERETDRQTDRAQEQERGRQTDRQSARARKREREGRGGGGSACIRNRSYSEGLWRRGGGGKREVVGGKALYCERVVTTACLFCPVALLQLALDHELPNANRCGHC